MDKLHTVSYEAPLIEIIEVEVEQGFATSINGWNDGGIYDESIII